MVETLSVSVSGPALSYLLYENAKSVYDQEGFLLGEIVEKETTAITDNDEQVTKIERIIKVVCAMPCPSTYYFYDGAGRINSEKVAEFLGGQLLKAVGWYKFKKHASAFKLTMREKVVHKELAKLFGSSPELFACCLLRTESSANGATHLYSQTFLRYYEASFQMLPMHIANLSDPNNTYKSAEPCSSTFNNIVKSLHLDSNSLCFKDAAKIQSALEKHAEKVVLDLAKSEQRLFDLEEEIKALRQKVRDKQVRGVAIIQPEEPLKEGEKPCEDTNELSKLNNLPSERGSGDEINSSLI